eukprot:1159719-Pelagomonas_calceolata.AAC.4
MIRLNCVPPNGAVQANRELLVADKRSRNRSLTCMLQTQAASRTHVQPQATSSSAVIRSDFVHTHQTAVMEHLQQSSACKTSACNNMGAGVDCSG